ncbi:MAG: ribokinase [Planctomycetaceae bacterium]|jgi:ribokinase|nr:ribokinase [Planctomycetaceae bacterium]
MSILIVGSSNTDMVIKSATLPKPGETVTGGSFFLAPGGKGANQAVTAARLGGNVIFAAKIGNDSFGQQAIAGYRNEGINISQIIAEKEHSTGIALILVDNNGENLISVASGANFQWSDKDIERLRPVIESADIVVMQLEIPLTTVAAVAEIAAAANVPVLLDPAPAQKLPAELLRNVSVLKPNQNEAGIVSGIEVIDNESAVKAAEKLLTMGVRDAVVITLGSKGALVLKRGGSPEFFAAAPVQAVDSTAAGDAFTGALAFKLSRCVPLSEAVPFANRVAALSTTKLGAQPSLPSAADV